MKSKKGLLLPLSEVLQQPLFSRRKVNYEAVTQLPTFGNCTLDNIFTERFWRNIKYEWLYLHSFDSVRELRAGLIEYIAFYNFKRIHQALGYKTPIEVYIMVA